MLKTLDKYPVICYNIFVNRLWVGKLKCDLAVVWKNNRLRGTAL